MKDVMYNVIFILFILFTKNALIYKKWFDIFLFIFGVMFINLFLLKEMIQCNFSIQFYLQFYFFF